MAEIYNSIVPNKIKIDYTSNGNSNNLHYDTSFLNVNTWYFGIDVNRPYYPSSGTGWYQGFDARTIDDSVYTIYYTGTTIGNTGNANDKYRCVQCDNQADVIKFVDPFFVGTPNFEQALNWFKDDGGGTSGGKGSIVCVNMNYPNIPTSGLTFALDAGYVASYPWINPTWFDFTQSAMSGFSGNSTIISNFSQIGLFFDFTNAGVLLEYFTNTTYNRTIGRSMTILFWAKPVYISDGRSQAVFSCAPTIGSPKNQSVGFYNDTVADDIRFHYSITDSSGNTQTRIGVDTIDIKVWHQFAYVFSPFSLTETQIDFYLDGTQLETNKESFVAASWSPSSPNWAIGQTYNALSGTKNYYGGLQVLLVYDRALSATEISDIYLNYQSTRGLFA
jgi:hypothetical protein